MPDNILQKLLELTKDKYNTNIDQCNKEPLSEYHRKYISWKFYFDLMKDEIDEAEKEFRKDNTIYLEDELGDILWDYLNLLHCLEEEWYISKEKVFERCLEKYTQRTRGIQNWISWDEIKHQQKQKLADEHSKKYSK